MPEPGPLRFAFRTLWQTPSLALAEVAWRWLYLLSAVAVLGFAVREVLHAVEISQAELVLVGLYRELLAGILFNRALPLMLRAGVVAIPLFTLLWVVLASVSRGAILRMLVAVDRRATARPNWAALMGLYAARALLAAAAVLSLLGTVVVCSRLIPVNGEERAVAIPLIGWLVLVVLVWMAWSLVDWFLQLAPIFAVRNGSRMWAATGDVVALFQKHSSECLSISGWFGFWRMALLMVTGFIALLLVSATGPETEDALLVLVMVLLADSAAASWLYVARLAAFVRLASEDGVATNKEAQRGAGPGSEPLIFPTDLIDPVV